MKRYLRFFAIIGVLALVLAACSPDDGEDTTTTTSGGTDTTAPPDGGDETTTTAAGPDETTTTAAGLIGEGKQIGMAFDIGGRGDLSFNDLAALAWDDGKRMYGYIGRELSPAADGSGKGENLQLLSETGHEMIIANGFSFARDVHDIGMNFPGVTYALTDDCPQDETFTAVAMDNVRCMLFAEEEGSFLVGAAAALKSTTGTIGFIGGVTVPLIDKFDAGFRAGALHVNPDIVILDSIYLTSPPDFAGFNDPVAGKEAALSLYAAGADVVYHAAGGSGLGLFEAADEQSTDDLFLWAIGVDADQYNTVGGADSPLSEHILTSMLKRVDVAVGLAIKDYLEGTFTPGEKRLGLADDGVGYSTTGGFVDDIAAELDALAEQIISGEIEVPSTTG